jgi:hypothetical protein
MKLDEAIERVASSETELADELEKVAERHRVDHDVFHLATTLAQMSRARVQRLDRDSNGAGSGGGVLGAVREKASEVIGSQPPAGLLLLRDLREIYMLASAASIDWTILGQAAQAAKDTDLLSVVDECHNEELRTLKWATTHIKELAPQALSS